MDLINGGYAIFPIIIVIFYAAELMWRERRVGRNAAAALPAALGESPNDDDEHFSP